MSFWLKHFGKIVSVLGVITSAILNIYMLYFNVIYTFILLVIILMVTYLYYSKQKYIFNLFYIIVLSVVISTINKEFMNLMDHQTYESFSEKQNALGMSGMILQPLILIGAFTFGILYDFVKNKNLNKS